MNEHAYLARMELAKVAMNEGRFDDAIHEYAEAATHTIVVDERAQAVQLLGVAERMAGRLNTSMESLKTARKLAAGNKPLQARIDRDLAMTLTETLNHHNRINLSRAIATLYGALDTFEDHDPEEYWITTGYIGRTYLKVGERTEARHALETADEHLVSGGNRDYELNNLVWLLRVLPVRQRLRLFKRAEALIEETGQTRRKVEVNVIVFGGDPAYRLFKRLHDSWQRGELRLLRKQFRRAIGK